MAIKNYKVASDIFVQQQIDEAKRDILSGVVGRYITSNSSGASFATVSALNGATTYYHNGVAILKSELNVNDFAFVVDSGIDHNNETGRFLWTGDAWSFQYTLSTKFSSAQMSAINSGVTASLVSGVGNIPTLGASTNAGFLKKTATAGTWALDNTAYAVANKLGLTLFKVKTATSYTEVALGGSATLACTLTNLTTTTFQAGDIIFMEVSTSNTLTNITPKLISFTLPTATSTSGGADELSNTIGFTEMFNDNLRFISLKVSHSGTNLYVSKPKIVAANFGESAIEWTTTFPATGGPKLYVKNIYLAR